MTAVEPPRNIKFQLKMIVVLAISWFSPDFTVILLKYQLIDQHHILSPLHISLHAYSLLQAIPETSMVISFLEFEFWFLQVLAV